MTRSSNEINDLFSGYSLKLHTTNSSAINIRSSQNLSTIEGLMNDFITSYNAVYGGISALSVGGASSASSGLYLEILWQDKYKEQLEVILLTQ